MAGVECAEPSGKAGKLTNCIVDQLRLPRFKAFINFDDYVRIGTKIKLAINNADYNDQGAFDAANNQFVAPVDGTYLFAATLLYKINASATARTRGRMVLNAQRKSAANSAKSPPPMSRSPLRSGCRPWRTSEHLP